MTTAPEKVIQALRKWQELHGAITQGTLELDRGEGVEVSDVKKFVGQIATLRQE